MNKVKLTKEGLSKLQLELEELKKTKRPKAIERLKTARAMGDLSENSEYQAAKEDLAFVEGRVQEVEELLKNVEIVVNNVNHVEVSLGSRVVVEIDGQRSEFQIVGEFEADPVQMKLSQDSPIGKALLCKRVGESVKVKVPAGEKTYKILEIK